MESRTAILGEDCGTSLLLRGAPVHADVPEVSFGTVGVRRACGKLVWMVKPASDRKRKLVWVGPRRSAPIASNGTPNTFSSAVV